MITEVLLPISSEREGEIDLSVLVVVYIYIVDRDWGVYICPWREKSEVLTIWTGDVKGDDWRGPGMLPEHPCRAGCQTAPLPSTPIWLRLSFRLEVERQF